MIFNFTDKQLIDKALDGSQRAWLKLVRRYENLLYNYCLRMAGSNSDALDLMQEVFLSTYRNLPSYRGDAQFKTWMMRIASNRTIDFLRQKSSSTQQLFTSSEAGQEDDENSPSWESTKDRPDNSYVEYEQNLIIKEQLKRLTADQRLLIELKFFNHFTFDEISYQTGISVNTIKSRIYAALKKLRQEMEKQDVM